MIGQIVKIISDLYFVKSNDLVLTCKCRGVFRNRNINPRVGDYVIVQDNIITEVKPRKNSLVRPPICNVTQALIVISATRPEFSTNLLDKLLVVIEYNSIKPIICITKMDLLDEVNKKKLEPIIEYYRKIGYQVLFNSEIDDIKKIFNKEITVITGQSGVGKSTLLNKLDISLDLATNDISVALGRGKHTTRHVELIELFGGLVADTPGFSALDLSDMSNEAIRDNFTEFNTYKEFCEYQDCFHLKETKCAVKQAVSEGNILTSRYENYQKFLLRK